VTGERAGDGGSERIALAGTIDADGFRLFHSGTPGRFFDGFGAIRVRVEGDRVRCRIDTGRAQSNISDNVHGGFIMACVDQVMFCAMIAIDRLPSGGAVTVECGTRFVGPAKAGLPLDMLVEVVGETGRMLFLRGLIEQAGVTVGSFDGTLRKIHATPPA